MYLFDLQKIFVQTTNVFVLIVKYICFICQIYLSKLQMYLLKGGGNVVFATWLQTPGANTHFLPSNRQLLPSYAHSS